MSRPPDPTCANHILPLMKRPQGFRSIEALKLFDHSTLTRTLNRLEGAQQAFAARITRREVYWFSTPEDAQACLRRMLRALPARSAPDLSAAPTNVFNRPTPMPGSGELLSPGNARRGAACWNPRAREGDPDYVEPYFPTDDQGRPLYRITRSAPVQPITRSNTHSEI